MDKKRVEQLKEMLEVICSKARTNVNHHHLPFGLPPEFTVNGMPVRWLFEALDSLVVQEPKDSEEEKMYRRIGELPVEDPKGHDTKEDSTGETQSNMIEFVNLVGASFPGVLDVVNWAEIEQKANQLGIHNLFVNEPARQINTDIPCKDIKRELIRGARKYGSVFNSPNEALGTIYSEFTELKNAIVAHEPPARIREEAVQVAAMAIKLVQYLDREVG